MARIELRDATIYLQDGLSGTAAVNEASAANNDTTLTIDGVNLNTTVSNQVPVGARFTLANENTVYTVTGRTPTNGATTDINFAPGIVNGANMANDAVITFLPQRLTIKIGEGNLTYTESKEYQYLLDRGDLDTVREGDAQPLEVSLEFVYEFVTTGTNEAVTPVDALKQSGGANEWVSASSDLCEPYCVDVVVLHDPPCGTAQNETTTLPDFRYESLEFNLSDATIAVSGRCNVVSASIARA
ncbi:MAG: hypothetical protein AMXMBFR16_10300 [Candidatus Uhrbacteria bacterium]